MRLLRADFLFTGRAGELIEHGEVLVDGDRIVAAGARGAAQTGSDVDVEVVDLSGHTLLPGLIDAHVHLGFDDTVDPLTGRSRHSDAELLLRMAENARRLVSAGVTTARDLGGRGFLDVALRDAIEAGQAVGPHLLVATRPITLTGGHCWHMGGEADDDTAIRRVARENLRAGADLLKVMASGGRMTASSPPIWQSQFTTEQIRIVVEEAGTRGRAVAAHAHAPASILSALEAGVTTIEHCTFRTESGGGYDAELVDRIAAAGVYVCPTVHGLFWKMRDALGAETMDSWLGQVKSMRDAGVRLIAGTDSGFSVGPWENRTDDFVSSLEVFAEAGFGAEEILVSATSLAAEACGIAATAGTLEAGKRADLIAVRGNPLRDLADLRRLELVMVSGRNVTQARR